jgi:protein O-mannosyl-transferase
MPDSQSSVQVCLRIVSRLFMGRRPKKNRPPEDCNPGRHEQTVSGAAERRCAVPAVCAFLLLGVALVFGQTVHHEFINYDDEVYVYENPHVVSGLTTEGVAWAFTTGHASNWHPLTWLSHMLDCQLYGLKPWGHHLSSVLLHAAAAILLFLVLRRMTGDLWPSAFVAAVFAIHPLRVESVAWVAERKDVLSGLFFMLTLAAYVAYVRHPFSLLRYLTVAVLFALGLMAKPMLVTLPFVLLLLDYWPLGRMAAIKPRPVAEKIPLFALAAASCVATSLAQSKAVAPLEILPLSLRIGNALVAYVAYIGQLFYPVGLAVFYPHPESSLPIWKAVGSLVVLMGASAVAVVGRRRFPYLFVGWFWYLGMLVPVIGLVQIGMQAMADRYTYLPQIGLCIVVAWAATQAVVSWPTGRRACGAGAGLAVLILMGCAWRQASYWCDSETLWTRTLACTTQNMVARYNFAVTLQHRGKLDEAIAQYREVLKIKPGYVDAYNNLGVTLQRSGRLDEAIAQYELGLKIDPDSVDFHVNLSSVLADRGQFDEAIAHCEKALQIAPDHVGAHNNLGIALAGQGRFDEAIVHYRRALGVESNHVEASYNLGMALARRGLIDEAISQYQRTLEIDPDHVEAHNNLGNALARRGRYDAAIAHYQRALAVKPNYVEAGVNLRTAQKQQAKMADAVRRWREALRSQPNQVVVLNQLAWVLATCPDASIRNGSEAVELARRAVRLSNAQEPAILGTLAAAYAEAGRFPEALQTARKALELATQQNKQALTETIQAKILLYQTMTPFRETSSTSSAPSTLP